MSHIVSEQLPVCVMLNSLLAQNAYISNGSSNTVSVVSTATNTVTATIPAGAAPYGVGVTPDGSKVYVTNNGSNTVSVISIATNMVITTVSVGSQPIAFGQFIVPGPNPFFPVAIGTPTASGWVLLLLGVSLAFLGARRLASAK